MAWEIRRKVDTRPEKLAMIEESNKELMKSFLEDMSKTRAKSTINFYKCNFYIFFCWNLEHNGNKPFEEISEAELRSFFDFCINVLEYGGLRFIQMHSFLSFFTSYVIEHFKKIERYSNLKNLAHMIENPTEVKKAVYYKQKPEVTPERIDRLLMKLEEQSKKDKYVFQEALFVILSICAGIEPKETLKITIDMIDEKATAYEEIFLVPKDKNKGGKNKVPYKYIVKDLFLPWYKEWLKIRKEIMEKHCIEEHNAIFIQRDGKPITEKRLTTWKTKWEKITNMTIYPYSFRHYFLIYLGRIGLEAKFIQENICLNSSEKDLVYNNLKVDERKWKSLGQLAEALEGLNTKKYSRRRRE